MVEVNHDLGHVCLPAETSLGLYRHHRRSCTTHLTKLTKVALPINTPFAVMNVKERRRRSLNAILKKESKSGRWESLNIRRNKTHEDSGRFKLHNVSRRMIEKNRKLERCCKTHGKRNEATTIGTALDERPT